METIMFAVGVLTMVLLAVASLAVYSTVMVVKLKKRIEELTRYAQEESSNIYRNAIEREDRTTRELHEINDHYHRNLDEFRSYVDRRFDKLIDTYLLVKETEKESKKLIKG
jgi:uncharacterized FlaG/YvyC family protein